ncbi:MAG: hypothetical protein DMG23_03560 [Acidobacteria bacterium]|nr:MAG: hypothetical protein DMG23_03560 [Acidobacteriota bacterium]
MIGPHRKRRGDRVSLAIPIQVRGTDVKDQAFIDETKTVVLSPQGATIVLRQMLEPDSKVIIRHLATGQEAECRVVGQIGGQSGDYMYGVAILDPTVNLWGIGFPPLAESEKAVGRVLLRCHDCRNPEVIYLDELEVEVFTVNRCISRPCGSCRRTTLWKEEEVLGSPPGAPSGQRTSNERKQARVSSELTACIRQAGFDDDVVITENISRGGLCFNSHRLYHPGSLIQVAVPYSPSGGNIFVPARIVYGVEIQSEGLTKHGAAYVKTAEI